MTPLSTTDDHMREVRERLVAIETKLDFYNETRTAANQALSMAKAAEDDIAEIKDTIKWTHRTGVSVGIPVVLGVVINVIMTLAQN